ncbi:Uncharacterized protein TCAP_05461 [Tolypocladium capitatum]|uniref:Aflatrem synthesis protein A n=1 Tax=Tolypocladium capitatum TaxID=45235 RepID=A0A2K3QAU6_9HYPO|nr:Uncharacterized protein TCAP_05461 [Tolypocladium capitatum]
MASKSASTALPDPIYPFRILTLIGFLTQWVTMMLNGSFKALRKTYQNASLASGTPLKTVWTGFVPLDRVIALNVAFFGAVVHLGDLPYTGSYLMLVDLAYCLAVFGLMTVVEDRRNRKTGPLRRPSYWQLLWNSCGAASILPIYLHLYFKKRTTKPLPADQAQALPFTAVWTLLLWLPLLLPGVVGVAPFQVQKLIVVWYSLPLTLGPVQDLISRAFASTHHSSKDTANPVIISYWVVGSFSAVIHISSVIWASLAPGLSWSSIYWPNHGAVQSNAKMLTEGAMLFLQYDYVVIYFCVLTLGVYMLGFDKIIAAHSAGEKLRAGRPLLLLSVVTTVGGPGAGVAWLMCIKEREIEAADSLSKKA